MKPFRLILQIIMFVLLTAFCGCEPSTVKIKHAAHRSKGDTGSDCAAEHLLAYAPYSAARVDILPLTEFTQGQNASGITVYVSLADSFSCQRKSPGVFRFELYNKLLRSTEPKGKRIVIWDDIDLTDPAKNNLYWQDFLRAYRFDLDFEPENGTEYILQVTCTCPDGKRLSAEFDLKK